MVILISAMRAGYMEKTRWTGNHGSSQLHNPVDTGFDAI